MGILYESALAYRNLLNMEYCFVLGRKGQTSEICIAFTKYEFSHLAGLHKLEDRPGVKTKRDVLFDLILQQHPSCSSLCTSIFYPAIEPRVQLLKHLETILDDNRTVFRYNRKTIGFDSKLSADYILYNDAVSECGGVPSYVFLDKSTNEKGQHYCRSLFPEDATDYTLNQPKYALLYKEKRNRITGSHDVLFHAKSYDRE